MHARQRRGFTIVEIIVVVAIIAVIAGLLLPALAGAKRRGRKSTETNAIRQVGVAWNLYANSNRGSALPGFLPSGIQDDPTQPNEWNVTYKYDKTQRVDPDHAQPWPMRLGSFLDFDHDTLLGYRSDLDYPKSAAMSGILPDGTELDDELLYEQADYLPDFTGNLSRPVNAAYFPAFGYNAYYVGGWYEYVQPRNWDDTLPSGTPLYPRPKYSSASTVPEQGGTGHRISVIVTNTSQIRLSSQLILFCSSTPVNPGVYERMPDDRFGSHYVIPRWMELGTNDDRSSADDRRMWHAGQVQPGGNFVGSESLITVLDTVDIDGYAAIPFGRHTGQTATVHGDLHVESYKPGKLEDQRFWINAAETGHFPTHRFLPGQDTPEPD